MGGGNIKLDSTIYTPGITCSLSLYERIHVRCTTDKWKIGLHNIDASAIDTTLLTFSCECRGKKVSDFSSFSRTVRNNSGPWSHFYHTPPQIIQTDPSVCNFKTGSELRLIKWVPFLSLKSVLFQPNKISCG